MDSRRENHRPAGVAGECDVRRPPRLDSTAHTSNRSELSPGITTADNHKQSAKINTDITSNSGLLKYLLWCLSPAEPTRSAVRACASPIRLVVVIWKAFPARRPQQDRQRLAIRVQH